MELRGVPGQSCIDCNDNCKILAAKVPRSLRGECMRTKFTLFVLAAAATVIGFTATAPKAEAQVAVEIGAAPDCPYGYYDITPYACAPAGYYGPEWFVGGVFIGAGPWFHGPSDFHGHVNNRFHPAHGYKGPWRNVVKNRTRQTYR